MPTIVSHKIADLKPKFFWMGGGHPVTKLSTKCGYLRDFVGGVYCQFR